MEEIEFRQNELPVTHAELRGLLHGILHEVSALRKEVREMGETQLEQDLQIESDVTALTTAFTNYQTAVNAEIAAIQASPAAADPVVATALANIETLTANIVAATTAATPAPPAPATPAAA